MLRNVRLSLLVLSLAPLACSRIGYEPPRRARADGSQPADSAMLVWRDLAADAPAHAHRLDAAQQAADALPPPPAPDQGPADAGSLPTTMTDLPALDDTSVARGSPDLALGDRAELNLGYCTDPANGNMRTWLKFDLGALPAGTTIVSARVQLFFFVHWGSQAYELHRAADDAWREETLTWNTQPSYDAEVLATVPGVTEDGLWRAWEVTAAVARELAGDRTLTVVLTGATLFDPTTNPPDRESYARSKEYAGAEVHPRLSIVHTR